MLPKIDLLSVFCGHEKATNRISERIEKRNAKSNFHKISLTQFVAVHPICCFLPAVLLKPYLLEDFSAHDNAANRIMRCIEIRISRFIDFRIWDIFAIFKSLSWSRRYPEFQDFRSPEMEDSDPVLQDRDTGSRLNAVPNLTLSV